VGSPGSGTETISKQVLKALGITYNDFQVFRLSFSENTEALKNKVIGRHLVGRTAYFFHYGPGYHA
ncbi:MAG: TAXI family TRAP transporter solute-binding subunit, partial [Bacillota bacterium]